MTNSELYRELYNLKEKNKDKFENISIEQFLYNISYYLETKYYDNYMNNENFLNLVKDSLDSNKLIYNNLFSLDETDIYYDIKLNIRQIISDKKLKLEKYKKEYNQILSAKKRRFITLIFLSILVILWVFLIFLKNRSELKEVVFGIFFSGFIIFGIYHFLGFVDAISLFFTKKPLFAMENDNEISMLSYGMYFKTCKLTELTNFYYAIINNLLYYYDELEINKKHENYNSDDEFYEDGIFSIESQDSLLHNKLLKIQLDSLSEVNWEMILNLVNQLIL